MAEPTTSPWGLYALMVFCIIMAISGFVWCFCCGTCVGRDAMRAAGLSRFVPPQYMQPSFMNRGGYQRKRSGDEEEGWEEEIDMDVLQDEAHDSSVEYDYDLSDDDRSDNETENTPYPRRPR
ncbi:hypothetical protein BKA57DRAFT_533274 [Linnemannia elongata]|nr:hypothetical protein BKA57DRAFT_533274 [Linnemannia elongata]KAK5816877.1 hypothetical protein F5H01DRAFT_379137 [Linnemannia elongata]